MTEGLTRVHANGPLLRTGPILGFGAAGLSALPVVATLYGFVASIARGAPDPFWLVPAAVFVGLGGGSAFFGWSCLAAGKRLCLEFSAHDVRIVRPWRRPVVVLWSELVKVGGSPLGAVRFRTAAKSRAVSLHWWDQEGWTQISQELARHGHEVPAWVASARRAYPE